MRLLLEDVTEARMDFTRRKILARRRPQRLLLACLDRVTVTEIGTATILLTMLHRGL